MYGTLDAISSGPIDARVSANSTMVLAIFPVSHEHIGIYDINNSLSFNLLELRSQNGISKLVKSIFVLA